MRRRIFVVLFVVFLLLLPLQGFAKGGFTSYFAGDPSSPRIAITVDDLFGLDSLESMLDLCQTYEIPMTFFALGSVIKPENAALWQRIVDEGHEIGNHTYGHRRITNLTGEQLEHQLKLAQETLDAVLREPYPMRLFRPPYGAFDQQGRGSVENLNELGYPYIILWSVNLDDVQRSYKNVTGGSIVLFHTNWQDVQCMDELIPKLLADGYELVTVSELLNLDPPADGNTGD